MDVNKIRIITLGNMKGDGDLMLKPASKNESEKIFVRKGSTTIFHKLADMTRGIKKAKPDVQYALRLTAQKNNVNVENINTIFKGIQSHIETPYTLGSKELENPIIFVSNGLSENEIESIKGNNSFIGKNYAPQKSSAANNFSGPPPPSDDIGPPPPNDIPKPPPLKEYQNNFNLQKKELKNNFKDEITKLLPKDELKIGKDHKNYPVFNKKLGHLKIEIESFSSYVVNQGIDIKNPGLRYLINFQKNELESEIRVVLSLSGKNDQDIAVFMADFSTQLENLTNKYLENGKV
jgi:hypothetical protein